MKKQILAIGSAVLIFTAQQGYGGSITDTYATGDTLTATQLNNIKAAVNDNDSSKQNRVTGTCPAGQSIRVINSDGTVTCEVDSVGSGDITSVSAGAGLTGGGISGGVSLSLTGAVSVSHMSFKPEVTGASQLTQCVYFRGNLSSYGYFIAVAGATAASCDVNAGVSIPDGVTLTGLSCLVYDNEAVVTNGYITAQLRRHDLATGASTSVYSTPITTDSTSVQVISDSTTSIGYNIVDNSKYAYSIEINFGPSDFSTVGRNLRVYGCKLSY